MPDSSPAPSRPAQSGDRPDAVEQEKAAWAARIEQHIDRGEYSQARELAKQALTQFPRDLGMRGLDSLAAHALRRSTEAAALLQDGYKLIEENRLDSGLDVLRRAERLDESNAEIRAALSDALIGRARALIATDRATAESLVREALTIQPDNPVALSLGALLSDYKQKEIPATRATPTLVRVPPTSATAPQWTAPVTPPEIPESKKRTPLFIGVAIAAVGLIVAIFGAFFALNRSPKPYDRQAKQAPAAQPPSRTRAPSKAQNTIYMPSPNLPAGGEPASAPAPNSPPPSADAAANLPLIVTANVPNAVVVLNDRELKTPLVNGKLTVRRPPGKYQVLVKADDYNPATAQTVELKPGATPHLKFTLNRIPHTATIAIESAPPDSEVLLDGSLIGTAGSGAFKKEISPGNHSITVRKPDYVDFTHDQPFAAGQTATINAGDMKAFGKLLAQVTPGSAHVTYKRAGETEGKTLSANGTVSIPPGDYVLESNADGFVPDLKNVTVASGKEALYAATLHPTIVAVEKITPQKVFANGSAWTFSDPDSWWTCSQKGFSFVKRDEGLLAFTIAKDTKPFIKGRVKKYEFVADYRDEENKIIYSFDAHHLTKKVFVNGKEAKEARTDVPVNRGDAFHLSIQILPDTVTVKVNGSADTTKRPESHGKFGFVDQIVLMPR